MDFLPAPVRANGLLRNDAIGGRMPTAVKRREQYDRELLESYSRPFDRDSAPAFVGRQDILELIEANCQEALKRTRNQKKAAGYTIVLQGAPGAGKTAVLSHLEEEWDGKKDRPHILSMDKISLKDPESAALEIIRKIDPSKAKDYRQKVVTNTGARIGLGVVGAEGSTTRATDPEAASFSILKEVLPPQDWKQPLCILVDEIQNVGKSHEEVLTALHLGEHRLPIVPIYAGLANSTAALAEAGLSRLQIGNVCTLGPLADGEVRSCVKQMLVNCRIDLGAGYVLDCLSDGVVERSEGWPQHVRTEAAALFWALGPAEGEIKDIDLRSMLKRARKYREKSYEARQSTEMAKAVDLVAAVMKELPADGGLLCSRVLDAIKGNAKVGQGTGWELPKGMDADLFLDHLIQKGALQPINADTLAFPIPSLRSWLIDRTRPGAEKPDPPGEFDQALAQWEAALAAERAAGKLRQAKDSSRSRRDQGMER